MRPKSVNSLWVSDIHWSEHPPVARSVETEWNRVQSIYFCQLFNLADKLNIPIFIVGDLFNRWDPNPTIINWVLAWFKEFPETKVYTIPGNHDIPYHDYTQLSRSAYWSLVEAGVINHLSPGMTCEVANVRVTAWPYGFEIKPPHDPHSLMIDVAMIHDYVWSKKIGNGYVDAPEIKSAIAWAKRLSGYEVAVFGDNHSGGMSKVGDQTLVTCGTFMRRYTNEKDYEPRIWKLMTDGSVVPHKLDTAADKFAEVDDALVKSEVALDIAQFALSLSRSDTNKTDFVKAVVDWLNERRPPQKVKDLILESIGANHGKRGRRY